ncbi:replication endonuclease [Diaphorobacter sp. HDW4A]|nr:replication endonuclease [Diaphorobacter sp. HDW4A]QIL83879.1 replication endonuclease [Diaphorobacter sp. HDW4A]
MYAARASAAAAVVDTAADDAAREAIKKALKSLKSEEAEKSGRGEKLAPLLRKLPNGSLAEWERDKPRLFVARGHMERVIACAPKMWRAAIRARLDGGPTMFESQQPEWADAWDLMQAIGEFDDRFGSATLWNLADYEIRDMAKGLAAQADELEAVTLADGGDQAACVDSIRMLVRAVGIAEDKPIKGMPAVRRAQDAQWWRKALRVHVARMVEAGAVGLGLVHKGRGGYVSAEGLQRRQEQIKRNAETLSRTLFRNEAGQAYSLAELAALGTSNPMVRGGELMTRIRGAEEYADSHGHVGLFLTLTLPSRFHPVKLGNGGRPIPNKKFVPGTTPRDGQLWLRGMWQKLRSDAARKGIKMYGLRVAEPHHDATPHWHALVWVETEAQALKLEERIRHYWLSDDGDERGAAENRVNIKRMIKGGAAGYVAKYIAKSVGHIALAEHQDVVNGDQIAMDFGDRDEADVQESGQGFRRVDAWAATWGIRQFQTIGMPSVTVWRELRRVSSDQLELFAREGDKATVRAHSVCHRHGALRADWRVFMEAMGGHACKRHQWHLRIANRTPEVGQANKYGEEVRVGRIVGLKAQRGRMRGHMLVSRRIAWSPVVQEHTHAADVSASTEVQITNAAGQAQGTGEPASREALPRAWTGFNNCTARLTGELRDQLLGREGPDASEWVTPEAVNFFAAMHRKRKWD